MAFQRRFQIGETVLISNPKGNRKHLEGHEAVIKDYQGTDSKPYRLNNGYWVSPKELSPYKETENGEPVIELLVNEVKDVKENIDLNKLAFKNQNFKVGDRIVIGLVIAPEQADFLNVGKYIKEYHCPSYERHFSKQLYKTGTIRRVDDAHYMYDVTYSDESGWDTFPALSIQHETTGKNDDPVYYKFQGSSDRNVKVYKNRVMVGNEQFTFELFEGLLKTINEHKKTPKTGYSRNIRLNNSWTGVLHDTYLQVGCQSFPYKNINRLCAAIKAVKKAVEN